ncbi:MAG: hypothetical protein AAF525_17910, partial [Pseudomonadota bacterium]
LDCHRIGMSTAILFMQNRWHPNDHMPPKEPGSLTEDWEELLSCWSNTPENTPGCDWVLPPRENKPGRVASSDYPNKAIYNRPGYRSLFQPGQGFAGGTFGASKKPEAKTNSESRRQLIEAMKAKGMTDDEIKAYLK